MSGATGCELSHAAKLAGGDVPSGVNTIVAGADEVGLMRCLKSEWSVAESKTQSPAQQKTQLPE